MNVLGWQVTSLSLWLSFSRSLKSLLFLKPLQTGFCRKLQFISAQLRARRQIYRHRHEVKRLKHSVTTKDPIARVTGVEAPFISAGVPAKGSFSTSPQKGTLFIFKKISFYYSTKKLQFSHSTKHSRIFSPNFGRMLKWNMCVRFPFQTRRKGSKELFSSRPKYLPPRVRELAWGLHWREYTGVTTPSLSPTCHKPLHKKTIINPGPGLTQRLFSAMGGPKYAQINEHTGLCVHAVLFSHWMYNWNEKFLLLFWNAQYGQSD